LLLDLAKRRAKQKRSGGIQEHKTAAEKNELLLSRGINFNDLRDEYSVFIRGLIVPPGSEKQAPGAIGSAPARAVARSFDRATARARD
jgi:hypothetical protein